MYQGFLASQMGCARDSDCRFFCGHSAVTHRAFRSRFSHALIDVRSRCVLIGQQRAAQLENTKPGILRYRVRVAPIWYASAAEPRNFTSFADLSRLASTWRTRGPCSVVSVHLRNGHVIAEAGRTTSNSGQLESRATLFGSMPLTLCRHDTL
jgi:hypothetical protein